MSRRPIISRRALLSTAIAASLAFSTKALSAGKPWRIGWLDHFGLAGARHLAFVTAMTALGYVEDRDFVLELRHAEWDFEKLPLFATELVRRRVDLIVASGDPAIRAAKDATATTPIVMVGSTDPVGLGFVASLDRPGGNITGISDLAADLVGKQFDFLKQTVPQLHKVLVLTNTSSGAGERARKRARQAVQAFDLMLSVAEIRDLPAARQLFARMENDRPDGLVILSEQLFDVPSLIGISRLALRHKMPLISDSTYMTYEDGLMSYQASYSRQVERAAWYADKIFKGSKPAGLPVEEPTKIRLTVNLVTAKAIGVAIPDRLVVLADRVIE